MLFYVSLDSTNLVLGVIPRDIQNCCGKVCLVDETLHNVPLVFPAILCYMLEISASKRLDHCIVDLLCDRVRRLVLTWTLSW